MDSGFYAACAGLAAQNQSLEVVAHNLANLSTAGYRAQHTTFRSLLAGHDSVALNPLNVAVNNFGVLRGSRLDLASGSLTQTGNPLDLAVSGGGFFSVQSPEGVLYTRNGSFHLTNSGQLTTGDGNAVLGQQGAIVLPSGSLVISSDGTISVGGNVVDRLQVAEFPPGTTLTAEGDSTYRAPADAAIPAADSTVNQGMLEGSNVSAIASVVQLITLQRTTEMLSRAVTAFDSQLNQMAVQDLPKV